MAPKALARNCCKLALDKRAEDVIIIDLRKLNAPTDYFVICSGAADRQVKAIADSILEGTAEKGLKPWHVEGSDNAEWVLIDYVNVVIHVFQKHIREYYDIEGLWGDAKVTLVESSYNQ